MMNITIPALAINEWLVKMIDKIYDSMLDFIWERGWDGRGNVLWDDTISLALALGALLSLFLVAKMAYKTMTLQEGIDFMKLWKPLAIVFVLSNWYVVTYVLFSLTQPFESYFREGFERQNTQIVSLQKRRAAAAQRLTALNREKMAEAEIGDKHEKMALTAEEIMNNEENRGKSEEELNDILISTYGELYLDTKDAPKDANGNPQVKMDATAEVKIAGAQNWLEEIMLYIAEMIWGTSVLVLFLVRAFFMSVLVMFGPVYMAVSVLPAWEDAWREWIERYVAVCFLGAAIYLGLIFASQIIIWGVHTDVLNWEYFVSEEKAWYEWLAHVVQVFCGSIGTYIVAIFVGMGVIGASFELATYFYPSQMLHSMVHFYDEIMNTGTAYGMKATDKAYKEGKGVVQKGVGTAQAWQIRRQEEKTKATLNMEDRMGPEGRMKDGRFTGEFVGRTNSYNDHRDSADTRMDSTTAAAHRWADRIWQQKVSPERMGISGKLYKHRNMEAARQDFTEYIKAQSEGKGADFIQAHKERMRENRIFMELMTDGKVGLHHFNGSVKERDKFLKKHGLYEAYMKAVKWSEKADKMKPGSNKRKQILQEAQYESAQKLYEALAIKAQEILAARGVHIRPFSGEFLTEEDVKEATKEAEELFGGKNYEEQGAYRIKETDRDYEKVQEQMEQEWFRKLSAKRKNREMLMMTLAAYEKALQEGRGEQFVRDMKELGMAFQYGFDEDVTVHQFDGVSMDTWEFNNMWDSLQDTDKLRKINEALDAIERANKDKEDGYEA